MTKILLLADINSPHTRKWVCSLADSGFTIGVFSLSGINDNFNPAVHGISFFNHHFVKQRIFYKSDWTKLSYLLALPALKKIILQFEPDIIHAHYASSYGLLGALSNFRPFVLSVWGSDVYDFPRKGIVHKKIFRFILKRAEKILSTSNVMAVEISKYTGKKISVISFGVDTTIFKPSAHENNSITIGTIKSLEPKYGIDQLIFAFSILKKKYPLLHLKLVIVGDGSLKTSLIKLANNLCDYEDFIFVGAVPHSETPGYHQRNTIFVAPSVNNSESFGVSAVEAMACGVPVIAYSVGGLMEVVIHDKTGLLIEVNRASEIVLALEKLILNAELRNKLGQQAREHVLLKYDWKNNLRDMIDIYRNFHVSKETETQERNTKELNQLSHEIFTQV